MFWNPYIIPALVGCILLFFLGERLAKRIKRPGARWAVGLLALLLCLPGLTYILYYAHIVEPRWWYIQFRSITGIETLSAFWGLFVGLLAGWSVAGYRSIVRRYGEVLAFLLPIALSAVPFIKPILVPLEPFQKFTDTWDGPACIQSTASTCGPASLAAILNYYGIRKTEREIARACYSCGTGTELWYLIRYARRHGLQAELLSAPRPEEIPVPSLVGVQIGRGYIRAAGHFITVLENKGDQITIGDPMTGPCLRHIAAFPGPSYSRIQDVVYFAKR
ncbi:MAG: cysteine peptidase family C39 domain-containing protein [Armatimonadota bacterium]